MTVVDSLDLYSWLTEGLTVLNKVLILFVEMYFGDSGLFLRL